MSEDESLGQNLKTYEEARKEEFDVAENGLSDEIATRARTHLANLLPDAAEELTHIVRVGNKDDAVRLQAIKLVFEYTLGKPAAKSTKEDDVDKVIKALTRVDE
jgi:hypothetical protein